MKNALALAALVALVTSPAAAACYGGPAFQTCNDQYVNSDSSAGITTMRGYNAQSGSRRSETVAPSGNMDTYAIMTKGHGTTRTHHEEPRRQSLFYTCTPYRGCK